jgi:hypothetical protein
VRIRKIEHGPENAAIEAAKRSGAENLCDIRVCIPEKISGTINEYRNIKV